LFQFDLIVDQTQNDWLRQYLKKRQPLLFEMIRLEAPPLDRLCTQCLTTTGTYRCKDCYFQKFYCNECCLSEHHTKPFHRIQRFVNGFFEGYDLNDLGFELDIRPHVQECSPRVSGISGKQVSSYPGSDDNESDWEDDVETVNNDTQSFSLHQLVSDRARTVIVASTGIFKRALKLCTCPNAPEKHIQLLRARLFPATFLNPKTAFTFEVLDHFRLDALECNTSAMNFMSKLRRKTNEIFPGTVPVCHQYRNQCFEVLIHSNESGLIS
jgi:CxC2 like cysteine cluster associated with KDZ transposases